MFGVLGILVGMGLYVLAAALLGHWIVGPINKAAGDLKAPTRFMLTDFIWLMLQLQIVLAATGPPIMEAVESDAAILLVALVCVPVLILWAASVSVVSRAQITRPMKRAVVILVVIPAALVVIMALPVLTVASIIMLSSLVVEMPGNELSSRTIHVALIVGLAILAAMLAYGLRRLSYWVVNSSLALDVNLDLPAGH